MVFRRELYASVSLTVCLMFLGLRYLDVSPNISTAICPQWSAFRLATPSALNNGGYALTSSATGVDSSPVALRAFPEERHLRREATLRLVPLTSRKCASFSCDALFDGYCV